MQQVLLDHLRKITEEEQRILDGVAEVDKDLYTSGKDFTVDSAKMLREGKLIAVRTHTRFVHFPSHRHNFIEVLYVCQGRLVNIIGGKEVVIQKGEQNRINQTTMGLIFLYLLESVQYAEMRLPNQYENMIAMTTLDYIEQQYRTATLTELCEKLHLPILPVSDVIAAVGYENGSYFHRVFKEHYHMTPRAFRIANSKEERIRL